MKVSMEAHRITKLGSDRDTHHDEERDLSSSAAAAAAAHRRRRIWENMGVDSLQEEELIL